MNRCGCQTHLAPRGTAAVDAVGPYQEAACRSPIMRAFLVPSPSLRRHCTLQLLCVTALAAPWAGLLAAPDAARTALDRPFGAPVSEGRATSRSAGPMAAALPPSRTIAAADSGVATTPDGAPIPAAPIPGTPTRAVPSATPPAFEVRDGERLSVALARFLTARGWELAWSAAGDFIVERAYLLAASDGDLPDALLRVLRPYRLSAVLHDAPPQRIVNVYQAQSDDDPGSAR
jgi:hypothetical protein